ncbi:MAG: hypothetical protein KKH98_09730, partial [Spirochaetes bacterium]|nr:hypothetical protein [Spirochaetota bacterium]
MKNNRFVFRVDGGNIYSVAMGHISRCLHLAKHISSRDLGEILFIMKDYPEGVNKVKGFFKVVTIPENMNINNEIDTFNDLLLKDDVYICDLRDIDNHYIQKIKEHAKMFVYFDDLGVKDLRPDVLINPSPYVKENDYGDHQQCTYLLGLEYFLLNSDFSERKG